MLTLQAQYGALKIGIARQGQGFGRLLLGFIRSDGSAQVAERPKIGTGERGLGRFSLGFISRRVESPPQQVPISDALLCWETHSPT